MKNLILIAIAFASFGASAESLVPPRVLVELVQEGGYFPPPPPGGPAHCYHKEVRISNYGEITTSRCGKDVTVVRTATREELEYLTDMVKSLPAVISKLAYDEETKKNQPSPSCGHDPATLIKAYDDAGQEKLLAQEYCGLALAINAKAQAKEIAEILLDIYAKMLR